MTRKAASLIQATRAVSLCRYCQRSLLNTSRPALLTTTRATANSFHTSSERSANPLPLGGTAAGPPPDPPTPQTAYLPRERLMQASYPKERHERFWKDVFLRLEDGRYKVLLDTRPIKTPAKHIISIPATKPLLAHALQVEWALMRTSKEALRSHFIPLTSLVSRAIDLEESEKSGKSEALESTDNRLKGTREDIVDFLMSYLDTDTILMISPTRGGHLAGTGDKQLRDMQLEEAQDMISWVKGNIPVPEGEEPLGIAISDGDHGLLPVPQSDRTRETLRKLVSELPAWELVGLERAVILGKSLLVGLRLVLENRKGALVNWDVEDAATACNLETDFQIEQWGLVEDTHDVNHADLRRGLGSVVLLVSEVEPFGNQEE
ncbi:hypothetical protein ABW19_dt0208103 [Dactylella cylindrospora]|nr:hypothetical protein ABW19_dt0208103 [Dactylella cylindrospora]